MAKNIKKAIIVKKLGMTSYFDENSDVQNVTVLQAQNLQFLDRLTQEKNGYSGIVVAYDEVKKEKLNKPQQGVFDKAKSKYMKSIKELRMDEEYLNSFENFELVEKKAAPKKKKDDEQPEGEEAEPAEVAEEATESDSESNIHDVLSVEAFLDEKKVKIQGKSKGKGFSGTIKAHNFARGPETHGSKNIRKPGSIGAGTDPARVFKGTRMAKRLGAKIVTETRYIISIDSEKQLIYVKGSVSGPKNSEHLLYC